MIEQRTAIVHDWFQGFHGAERVVETMRSGLFAAGNEPDIFTFHAAKELLPPDLPHRSARSRASRACRACASAGTIPATGACSFR